MTTSSGPAAEATDVREPRTEATTSTPRPHWAGRLFANFAIVEAVTWAGLVAGMYLKYVPKTTDEGVRIFGSLHGAAFLIYLVVTVVAAVRLRWRWGTILLAVLAAVPPLATIPVELWMRRTGRLEPR